MESIREYIIENFDNDEEIFIPWELRKSITIRDIVFISLHKDRFELDEEYDEHIFYSEENDYYNNININERFENHENICLLYLIMNSYRHNGIFSSIYDENGELPDLFSEEFIENCLEYVTEHNFENNFIGEILNKIKNPLQDEGQVFSDNYLGKSGTKSARNI